MACPDPTELHAYLEGFATPEQKSAMRAHLEFCAACRADVLALAPSTPLEGSAPTLPEPRAPAPTLPRGQLVGRYVVLNWLGEGGMGVVYAAYDPELDRKVALKLIRSPLGAGDRFSHELQKRLPNEAQAMARMAHPNVVAVHDIGRHGDQVFIAMELIDGQTLAEWLHAPRSTDEIVAVFARAARGLAAAHSAGLVHRDFKPNNVMIDRDGRVRVMDFGLARSNAAQEAETPLPSPLRLGQPLTAPGVLMGTPAYMAPEQLDCQPVDARTDLFSFCVALYEALAGTRPFIAADTDALRVAIREAKVARPTRPVSGWLLRIVERGLVADPAARWPSMEALLAALDHDPRRRRRRGLAIAAASLLVLAPIGLVAGLRRERGRACASQAAPIDAAWNADRRRAVHSALVANRHSDGERLFSTVAAKLDDYAASWRAMTVSACEATRVTRAQSEDWLRTREACLDTRLAELRSLVGIFATADADVAARAESAVGSLSSIEDCADLQALRSAQALPSDPVQRAEAQSLERTLAELKTMASAGRYRQLLDEARAIEPRVLALHHRPTEASLRVRQAGAYANLGNVTEARRAAQQAIVAAEAGGDARAAIEGWSELLHVATDTAQGGAADEAFEHGMAWAERSGDQRGRISILQRHGNSLADRGAGERAVTVLEEALRLAGSSGDADLMDGVEGDLAAACDLAGQTDRARKYYEHTIASRTARHGDKSIQLMAPLENLGLMLHGLGDEAGARVPLERAYAIIDEVLGPDSHDAGDVLSSLSMVAVDQGRLDDAHGLAQRSLTIYEKLLAPTDAQLAYPLTQLGEIIRMQGKPAVAVPLLERALALREKSDVSPVDLAVTQGDLGRALIESHGDARRGERLLGQARATFVERNLKRAVLFMDEWRAKRQ